MIADALPKLDANARHSSYQRLPKPFSFSHKIRIVIHQPVRGIGKDEKAWAADHGFEMTCVLKSIKQYMGIQFAYIQVPKGIRGKMHADVDTCHIVQVTQMIIQTREPPAP